MAGDKGVAACYTPDQFPPAGLPEVAMAGRSNVGKSSLINALLGRRAAHVGATPGKTRSVNFYRVEGQGVPFCLVDLPGYGYAARSKAERNVWGRLVSAYAARRPALACHLVDFRHGLLANDRELQDWFVQRGIPMIVVFTKADKLPRGRWRGLVQAYVQQGLYSLDVPLVTSAESGAGIAELRAFIANFLKSAEVDSNEES